MPERERMLSKCLLNKGVDGQRGRGRKGKGRKGKKEGGKEGRRSVSGKIHPVKLQIPHTYLAKNIIHL